MINNKDFDNSSYSSYKIIIDNQTISNSEYPVISIQTIQNINKIPSALIIFRDGEEDIDNFENSSSNFFNPGNKIEIKLGWGGNDYTVFKGIIIRHSISASERKGSFLKIYCRNEALKMTTHVKSKCYNELEGDNLIIEEVFNNNSINVTTNGEFANNKSLIQYDLSDWDFALERTEANGKVIYYSNEDDKFVIEDPDASGSSLFTYQLGKDIIKFDAEADAEFQLENINTYSWNSEEQEMKKQESVDLDFNTFQNSGIKSDELASILNQDEIELKHGGERSSDEFKFWVKAKKTISELSKVQGSLQILGDSRYEIANCISVDGVGDKFSDNLFITGIKHTLNSDGFYTDIVFGIDNVIKSNFLNNKNSSSFFSNISGLQTGIVTNIIDEESLNRIEVNIPILGQESKIWCRVLYSDAGSERGFFSLPEIDDEVILGFINNDPQCPIVLGFLYSKKNVPVVTTEEITEENYIKGWFSKSNISVLVNDEERSIEIKTPDNTFIKLEDETKSIEICDVNENKIKLDENGINVESSSDINFKSTGDIIFSSDGDLNVNGSNISINANQNATVEGSSGTDIKSSGNTVIKGSMVQIN